MRTRIATLLKFFRAYCDVAVGGASLLGTGEPLTGVAIWSRPADDSVAIGPRTLGAFLPLLATLYPLGLLRARPIIRLQGALRRRHAPARHYYLDNVAVHPDRRGQRIASALIRPVLALTDREVVATYTDTFTAANVPLYEHFGFRCLQQQREPTTGLSVWSLLRQPSS